MKFTEKQIEEEEKSGGEEGKEPKGEQPTEPKENNLNLKIKRRMMWKKKNLKNALKLKMKKFKH